MAEREEPDLSWLDGPSDFDRSDQFSPLFDSLWAVHGMGRHSDRDHDGVADAAEEELHDERRFTGSDGSVYLRADPDEFEADDVD